MMRRRTKRLEHLLEADPVKDHERIMQMLQPTQPAVVFKEYTGEQPPLPGNGDEPPLYSTMSRST